MDSLKYQDVILFQPDPVAFEGPAAGLEIVLRDFDFLSGKELVELAVEELKIHRVE